MDKKKNRYIELVEQRKSYNFKDLKNPSQIANGIYDNEVSINPWSLWQGNLDAEILVIGQDWGDENYYLNNRGRDNDNNPTNKNLRDLFQVLNIDTGRPNNPNKDASLFFTNAIMGIKQDGMSSNIKASWLKESAIMFLKPLIGIIEPKIIITLGANTFKAIKYIYPGNMNQPLRDLQSINPINVNEMKLFAFYHCGGLGLANRPLNEQKKDWEKINSFL